MTMKIWLDVESSSCWDYISFSLSIVLFKMLSIMLNEFSFLIFYQLLEIIPHFHWPHDYIIKYFCCYCFSLHFCYSCTVYFYHILLNLYYIVILLSSPLFPNDASCRLYPYFCPPAPIPQLRSYLGYFLNFIRQSSLFFSFSLSLSLTLALFCSLLLSLSYFSILCSSWLLSSSLKYYTYNIHFLNVGNCLCSFFAVVWYLGLL